MFCFFFHPRATAFGDVQLVMFSVRPRPLKCCLSNSDLRCVLRRKRTLVAKARRSPWLVAHAGYPAPKFWLHIISGDGVPEREVALLTEMKASRCGAAGGQ